MITYKESTEAFSKLMDLAAKHREYAKSMSRKQLVDLRSDISDCLVYIAPYKADLAKKRDLADLNRKAAIYRKKNELVGKKCELSGRKHSASSAESEARNLVEKEDMTLLEAENDYSFMKDVMSSTHQVLNAIASRLSELDR